MTDTDKILHIVRGIPGSGKTTMAREIAENPSRSAVICEADHYFYDEYGNYNFDATLLPMAHNECKCKAQRAMENEVLDVIVSNTTTTPKEAKDYIEMAVTHGYRIEFKTPDTKWATDINECAKTNLHGVPKAAITRMAERFVSNKEMEKYASELEEKILGGYA